MKALTFSDFRIITEGWIYTEFADSLTDFDFEKEFGQFLGEYEAEWERLKRDYNWNREARQTKVQHFAVDAQIHTYPELDQINSVLGTELTDEELREMWWSFTMDWRDNFVEDVRENYSWVKGADWDSKKGDWLLIFPAYDDEDFEDEITYHLSRYAEEKLHTSQEAILTMQKQQSDPKLQKLIQLGLAEPSGQLAELKRDIASMTEEMEGYLSRMRQYRASLEEIAEIPREFEEHALDNFVDWMQNTFDY